MWELRIPVDDNPDNPVYQALSGPGGGLLPVGPSSGQKAALIVGTMAAVRCPNDALDLAGGCLACSSRWLTLSFLPHVSR